VSGLTEGQWRLRLWASNDKSKQWYAVFRVGADLTEVEQKAGVNLSSYFIPNNACLFVGGLDDARRVAQHKDVEWVAERPQHHKLSPHLITPLERLRMLKKKDSEAVDWVLWSEELAHDLDQIVNTNTQLQRRAGMQQRHRRFKEQHQDLQRQLVSRQTLMVTLHNSITFSGDDDKDLQHLIDEWAEQLRDIIASAPTHVRVTDLDLQSGFNFPPSWLRSLGSVLFDGFKSEREGARGKVELSRGGPRRVLVRVTHHALLDSVVSWLSEHAQVLHIEHMREQHPHAGDKRRPS
jgi:hypothetical protein